jgi:hypothetical protein
MGIDRDLVGTRGVLRTLPSKNFKRKRETVIDKKKERWTE